MPLVSAVALTSTLFRHALNLSQPVDALRPLPAGDPGTIYAYSPKRPRKGTRMSERYRTTTDDERRGLDRCPRWKRTMFVLTITHHALQCLPGPSQRPILIEVLGDLNKRGPCRFFSFGEVSDELGHCGWWLGGFGAFG